MPVSARWRWRLRQVRSHPANLLIPAVVALIVGVAIDRGITSHLLNWALLVFYAMVIPVVILHEMSHGIVANWCGDDTAKRAGRISLNPRRHIDPLGSVLLPAGLLLLGAPPFAFARPVPVTLNRLRRPRNQAILVSLAGPVLNLLLAVAAAVAVHAIAGSNVLLGENLYYSIVGIGITSGGPLYWLGLFVGFFGLANVFIGVFNLIPIPPLDGSAVLERFIPISAMPTYYQIRRYFIWVVFFLVIVFRNLLGSLYVHLAMLWANPVLPHF